MAREKKWADTASFTCQVPLDEKDSFKLAFNLGVVKAYAQKHGVTVEGALALFLEAGIQAAKAGDVSQERIEEMETLYGKGSSVVLDIEAVNAADAI